MRAFSLASLVAISMLFATLPASAYTSTGTDPSAASPALYVHRNSGDAAYWLSNVADEPDADDPDPGYNVLGIAPLEAAGLGCGDAAQYCWQIPMDPAPAGDIVLDSSQPTRFHLIYQTIASVPLVGGAGGAPGYGAISASLVVDGEVVASVEGPAAPTSGDFETVDLDSDTGISVIPAGANVILDVRFDGVSGGALLGADGTHDGNTHVLLPLPPAADPGPEVIFEDLETADIEQAFDNATSATYVLNLTVEHDNATAAFAWNAESGSVNVTIYDAEGAELTYGPFSGQGEQEEELDGLAQGDWNVTLQYTNYTGSFAFSIGATPSDDGGDDTETQTQTEDPSSTTSPAPQGNETGNETLAGGADGEEASALPFVLATLALVAVARWRRR